MEVEWTLGFAIAEIVPTIFSSDYTPPYTPPPLDDEYTISSLTDTDADTGSGSIDEIEHTIEVPIVYLDEVEEEAVQSTEQQQQQEEQQESVANDGDELGQIPAQEEEGEVGEGIEEVIEKEEVEEGQVNSESDATGDPSEDANTIEHVIDPVSDEAVAVESTAQEKGHNSDLQGVDLNPKKVVQKPFLLNILTSIIQIPLYLFTLVYKLLTLPLSLLLTTREGQNYDHLNGRSVVVVI